MPSNSDQIKKNPNGVWYTNFTVQGRRIRKSTGTRVEAIARRVAEKIEREEWAAYLAPAPTSPTFAEAALAYMEGGGDRRFLERILVALGPEILVTDLDGTRIARLAVELYPEASEATRQRQIVTPVRAVVRHSQGLRRQPRADTPRTRWLMPEEAEQLLAAADTQTAGKIAFLLGSGCRTGEMFKMDASDFHPATGQAWVAMAKNGEGRMLDLFPRALGFVLEAAEREGAMWRTPKGRPYVIRANGGGQMKEAFDKARSAAGLGEDVTPHVLRHTWATWRYALEKDLLRLKALGGWRSSAMAERYTKLAPADLPDRLIKAGWGLQGFGKSRRNYLRSI